MDFNDIIASLGNSSKAPQKGSVGVLPGSSKRPDDYLTFESLAISEALGIAQEFPGHELRIWRDLSELFDGFNQELRAIGAHELKLVPFEVFLGMTELDAEEAL